jgi:hypothetical protein
MRMKRIMGQSEMKLKDMLGADEKGNYSTLAF